MGDVYWGVHAPIAAMAAETGVKRAIETGTFYGLGALSLAAIFDTVITIEREEALYSFCADAYNSTKISFRCGESPSELRRILQEDASASFFFLDAHWFPAPALGGSKASNQCPILEEIETISEFTSADGGSVIVIDDADMFLGSLPTSFNGANFPGINILIRMLSDQFGADCVEVLDDVIVAGGRDFAAKLSRYKKLKAKFGAPSSKSVQV
nr:hypothetical protein [uncultured Hyphomonas sp.]